MAHIVYVSRTDSAHDARWKGALASAGHEVSSCTSEALARFSQNRGESRPDLIVAGPLTDCLAVVEAEVAPVLGLCWGFDVLVEAQESHMLDRLERALPHLVGIHVDCQDLRVRISELGANPQSISVGAWGIDVDFFHPGLALNRVKEEVGWGSDHKVVYTSRTCQPLYGVDVVLKAFAEASDQDPSLRLAWAGDGPLKPSLRQLAVELGVDARIAELGILDPSRVRDWLRTSDLYVSASISDGSSVSLMEALGVGIPVAVTDIPSNGEWVTSQEVGSLFPVADHGALARVISHVTHVTDPSSIHKRRDLVLRQGDWARNAQIFLSSIEKALA